MRPGKYTTGSRLPAQRPGAGRFFKPSKGVPGLMPERKATDFKNIPILLIDVANFSLTPSGTPGKRALITSLQEVLRAAASFFVPKGDPWEKWKEWPRHGTGDGYYYLFDAVGRSGIAICVVDQEGIGACKPKERSGLADEGPHELGLWRCGTGGRPAFE